MKKLACLIALVLIATIVACCKGPTEDASYQVAREAEAPKCASPSAMVLGDQLHRFAAPAGPMPSTDEEIWVIERPPVQMRPIGDGPRTGAMVTTLEEKEVPLPLKHTDVKARVGGYIATVEVTQQFHNPFEGKIEAVYLFPLPQNAAVSDFLMIIGTRRIRGIIREREEARKIYDEAKRQGYVASLLSQERANIFTQRVANIEPGKQIDVHITYFQTLAYNEGWYEFAFPMVVGPRFNPPGSTEGIGAVGYGTGNKSVQKNVVHYLPPGTRSGHDISLSVALDVGVPVEQIVCPTHVVARKNDPEASTIVTLSRLDTIPNKDFVLRYKVAGGRIKSTLMTQRDKRGGYFTLMLFPPEHLKRADRKPMELIFVVDCSGSMSGWPIQKAKEATERALRRLEPGDTFQVIRFSNSASQFGPVPVPATPANVRKGIHYVRGLSASGGTMMLRGIRAALGFPHDKRRLRVVSFMTDGFIGNEKDILSEVHHRVGPARIFSFGVGSSPNRYLLERMAKLGRGAVAYIGSASTPTAAVDRFYRRVSHPAMSDIRIDWGDMRVSEVFPSRIPDLFVGRPVVVTGRFAGKLTEPIRVTGKIGKVDRQIVLAAQNPSTGHEGLPSVWARLKIADLADRSLWQSDDELPQAIKQIALEYGLMSAYTSFIAVDATRRTAGDHGTTVPVPVPVPHGTRYETTVEN